MGMVHDRGNAVPFHGDHHPVKVATYRKSRNIFSEEWLTLNVNNLPQGFVFVWDNTEQAYVGNPASITQWILPIEYEEGATYTVSLLSKRAEELISQGNIFTDGFGLALHVFYTDGSSEYVPIAKNTSYTLSSYTTKSDATVREIKFTYNRSYISYVKWMQIELGSTATEYEPYGLIEEPIFEPIDRAQDGKTLTFENTYNDVAEVSVAGNSEQVQLTGKNLIDYASAERGYINGNRYELNAVLDPPDSHRAEKTYRYIGIKPSTDYTLHMKCGLSIPNNSEYIWFCVVIYQTDGSYFLIARTHDYGENESTITFTTKPNTYAVAISWRSYESEGEHFIQLEAGSTATEYEPYCGGIPSPNPDYPQPIESIKSVELVSRNADGSKSATRTIDLQGHELRSLPDGTHDELIVNRDGTVELVQRVWLGKTSSIGNVQTGTTFKYAALLNHGTPPWKSYDDYSQSDGKPGMAISNKALNRLRFGYRKDVATIGRTWNGVFLYAATDAQDSVFDVGEIEFACKIPKQTIQLPSIDPLPTYHPYTVVDGNGADISACVRVFE